MAPSLTFRSPGDSDAEPLSELVQHTFVPATLAGWSAPAIEHLYEENSPDALRARLKSLAFAEVCVADDALAGFIIFKLPRLLSLLVVTPSMQRSGVGSLLLQRALQHVGRTSPEVSVIEVNASEYSVSFYRHRGFYPISEFIEFEGCRFVRMAYWRKSPLLVAP